MKFVIVAKGEAEGHPFRGNQYTDVASYTPLRPGNTGNQEGAITAMREMYDDAEDLYKHATDTFEDPAGAMKDIICTRLSEEAGLDYDDVNVIMANWATSANDTYPPSQNLQKQAAYMFDVPLSEWQQSKMTDLAEISDAEKNKMRRFLDMTYTDTQGMLEIAGYKPDDVITMYRGVLLDDFRGSAGDIVNYKGNTLESWTLGKRIADQFTNPSWALSEDYEAMKNPRGVVLSVDVPVKNIISSCITGFGCSDESEFVILGSVPGSTARIISNSMVSNAYAP